MVEYVKYKDEYKGFLTIVYTSNKVYIVAQPKDIAIEILKEIGIENKIEHISCSYEKDEKFHILKSASVYIEKMRCTAVDNYADDKDCFLLIDHNSNENIIQDAIFSKMECPKQDAVLLKSKATHWNTIIAIDAYINNEPIFNCSDLKQSLCDELNSNNKLNHMDRCILLYIFNNLEEFKMWRIN